MSAAAGQRRALVTGGAGFIGSHLVDRLVDDGWRVRVLDDFSTGFERNFARSRGRIDLVRGDLSDYATASRAVEGMEVVFHQAAIPSVPRSVADPLRTNAVNADGTLFLLQAALDAGVRRVIYAGSSSVYGDTEQLPKRETMPANPASPYALQKYAGEVYCGLFTRLYKLETVALRYFNVFGPRQDPNSPYSAVIPLFIRACLCGEPAQVHGDGEQTRDFTFVANAVEANLLAADAHRAAGAVINVAGGRRIALNELLREVQQLTGTEIPPAHGPSRPGDVRHSLADLTQARELLDYEPLVDLREGLRLTIESMRTAEQGGSDR